MKIALKSLPEPLNKLSSSERIALEEIMRPISFSAGSYIFKEGTTADGCYIVEKGIVRIEASHIGSHCLEEGAFFGEISLLEEIPLDASAFAQTNVVVHKLSINDLNSLIESNPRILVYIWQACRSALAKKAHNLNKQRVVSKDESEIDPEIEEMLEKAKLAQQEIQTWSEKDINALLLAIATSVAESAEDLATETVKITHLGNIPDKILKNKIASLGIYRSLVGKSGLGLISYHDNKVLEIASPMGVIFGMIPVTNPVATAIFKTLISIKSRNALILSFPITTKNLSISLGEKIQAALNSQGAPIHLVQWLKYRNSRKKTEILMRHKHVSLILATGGASMVKAAYSSGNPAIGVGPGNTPTLICADADIEHAAWSIVLSKCFDNGLICGSEHNLVVDWRVRQKFIKALTQQGAAVLTPEEEKLFAAVAFTENNHKFQSQIIGKSAEEIANSANIKRDYRIKLIVVPSVDIHQNNPYAYEKTAPVLSLFTVQDEIEGIEACQALLQIEGMGHTAIIYSKNDKVIQRFGLEISASRILVNSPGSHGIFGFTTGLTPSLTLGCGSFGGNSTTDNVTYKHLYNIKRMAYYQTPKNLDEVFEHLYPKNLLKLVNLLNDMGLGSLVTLLMRKFYR